MTDLPLFNWQPPACTVLAFPLSKRVGKIRRTAEVLSGKNGKAAIQYRATIIESTRGQMAKSGLSEAIIESEIRAFETAVERELNRLSMKGKSA